MTHTHTHRERDAKNPLEPLLLKYAMDFSDDRDLSERLTKLYKVEYFSVLLYPIISSYKDPIIS